MPVVTRMSTNDIISQKASAACEGSTSSPVSRVNKRGYFFSPHSFFSSQKTALFFIFLFTKQEEVFRKKHSMFTSKPAWHSFLWQIMRLTRARFQSGRNRGASQPLSIHEGISLSAGTGLNGSGIFAFGSGGFLDTAFPPPPTSCANKA